MKEFLLGALIALVVNVLTVLGWMNIGMWFPAVSNVLLALVILGVFGLEDKWAFPLGYWAIELLSIAAWVLGMGALFQLAGGPG